MAVTLEEISALIRARRSVYPRSYRPGAAIDRVLLEQLLENAVWAPTHKLTQPWRFEVFHSEESRAELGDYLAGYYEHNTQKEQITAEKLQKMRDNPRRAGAVIALILHPDAAAALPEFEEVAALAMAVQNMWLSCAAAGLGCYWSTPGAVIGQPALLRLEPGERCLGLFYLGWHDQPGIPGKRTAATEKTTWR